MSSWLVHVLVSVFQPSSRIFSLRLADLEQLQPRSHLFIWTFLGVMASFSLFSLGPKDFFSFSCLSFSILRPKTSSFPYFHRSGPPYFYRHGSLPHWTSITLTWQIVSPCTWTHNFFFFTNYTLPFHNCDKKLWKISQSCIFFSLFRNSPNQEHKIT